MNNNFLKKLVSNLGVPGCGLAIQNESDLQIEFIGYLNDEKTVEYSIDTVVRIGCVIKLFVSAQILLLQEERLINVNDCIINYLDNPIVFKSKNIGKVTFKHLMTHTSGLIGSPPRNELAKVENVMDYISSMTDETWFLCRPGDKFSYSSLGYVILGYLIEVIRGRNSWLEDLNERIFSKLDIYPKIIKFSERPGKKIYGPALSEDIAQALTSIAMPGDGGGLALTAKNLCDYGYLFLNNGMSRTGEQVLSKETVHEILQCHAKPPVPTEGILGFGYGWWISPDGSAGLNGDGTNNHACFKIDKKSKLVFSLIANYHPASVLFNSIWDHIAGANSSEEDIFISPKVDSLQKKGASIDLEAIPGTYINGHFEYKIEYKENAISVERSFKGFKPEISKINCSDNAFDFLIAKEFGKFPQIYPIELSKDKKYEYIWNGVFLCKRINA